MLKEKGPEGFENFGKKGRAQAPKAEPVKEAPKEAKRKFVVKFSTIETQ